MAGGIARHLGVDPVLVRLATVALALAGGSGVLAYLIAWVIIPEVPRSEEEVYRADRTTPPASSGRTRMIVGVGLVVVGVALLAQWAIPSFDEVFWPVVVIASGAALLIHGVRR